MTDKNRQILMADQDSVMGFYLSQSLINKGISPVKINEVTGKIPIIFTLLNYRRSGLNLENLAMTLKEKKLQPDPLFIITTETAIEDFGRLDDLQGIVEIQIDPLFDDVIKSYEDMKDHIKTETLTYIETVMEEMSEIISQYLDHPPNDDEYVIEKITIQKEQPTIGVVGLGYVGLPVAVGFAEKYPVIGFDINEEKIASLTKHIDNTGEVSAQELKQADIEFTTKEKKLQHCHYIIVVVPTPITEIKTPDLTYLQEASKIVGRNLTPGTIVIYESTVYPGTTEEVCIPILETYAHLEAGKDFHVGYSPERINPGDKQHTFKKINKVVAGQNDFALEKITELYQSILDAKVYQASSIKVAEAAKVVENTQRDINIAFMNELAMIFKHVNLDTTEVLKAAQTKWNFLPFTPGLVGGHCIGIDPYYLIYQAQRNGYQPAFISSARAINDQMPAFIVQRLLALMVEQQMNVKDVKITVLGITFKENIPDMRNSKALEIVHRLIDLGLPVQVCDPMVQPQSLANDNIHLQDLDQLEPSQIVIMAVPHKKFNYTNKDFFTKILSKQLGIVMDIKGIIPNHVLPPETLHWKL